MTDDEVRVAVTCAHGDEPRTRLIDRILLTPSTGRATLAKAGNADVFILAERRSTKYRLQCPRCHLDVVLNQATLNALAEGLHTGGLSTVALPHLARLVATLSN